MVKRQTKIHINMIKIVISRRETLILAQVGLHWVVCTVLYIPDTLDLENTSGGTPFFPSESGANSNSPL